VDKIPNEATQDKIVRDLRRLFPSNRITFEVVCLFLYLNLNAIDIYLLENYVDKKEKSFWIDKNIQRIVLALVQKGNEFFANSHQGILLHSLMQF
jgi:hypothetical protein